MVIAIWIEIVCLISLLLKIATVFDSHHNLCISKKIHIIVGLCSIMAGVLIRLLTANWIQMLLLGVFAAYLISAAITDAQTQMVYDYMHLAATVAGIILYVCNWPSRSCLVEFSVFALLQLLLFDRFYGRADVYSFIVCALFYAAMGHTMITYLMHMSSVFIILAVIQLFKRNVNKKGNLKVPVPLLPYIASTAMLFL